MGKYLGDFTFDDEDYLEQLVDIIFFMHMIFFDRRARAILEWTGPQGPGPGPAKMAEGWPGVPGPARGQSICNA